MARPRRLWLSWLLVGLASCSWLDDGIRVDDAAMADLQGRLEDLRPELEALPAPAGAQRDEVSVTPDCIEDSGDLLGQPGVQRLWTFGSREEWDAAVFGAVAALQASGWRLHEGPRATSVASDGDPTLRAERSGRTVEATIGGDETLFVTMRVVGLEPCTQE